MQARTRQNNACAKSSSSSSPGRQSTEGAHGNSVFGSSPADIFESRRHGAVAVQQVVRHHEGEGGGHPEVGHEAYEQRGYDANGDGSLGILHLFTYGTDGEKAGLKGVKCSRNCSDCGVSRTQRGSSPKN